MIHHDLDLTQDAAFMKIRSRARQMFEHGEIRPSTAVHLDSELRIADILNSGDVEAVVNSSAFRLSPFTERMYQDGSWGGRDDPPR